MFFPCKRILLCGISRMKSLSNLVRVFFLGRINFPFLFAARQKLSLCSEILQDRYCKYTHSPRKHLKNITQKSLGAALKGKIRKIVNLHTFELFFGWVEKIESSSMANSEWAQWRGKMEKWETSGFLASLRKWYFMGSEPTTTTLSMMTTIDYKNKDSVSNRVAAQQRPWEVLSKVGNNFVLYKHSRRSWARWWWRQ